MLAPHDVHQTLGGLRLFLAHGLAVLDDGHADVRVKVGQHIQVQPGSIALHLDDVLAAAGGLVAACVLDQRHAGGAVALDAQQVHQANGGACLDVVDHDAVLNFIDVQHISCSSFGALGSLQAQQGHDQCHADVDAVLHLLKIGGAGVVVHVQRDLVDAGQGMQHGHVRLCQRHLFVGQDVAVLQADVVLLVEEALLLHAGHVQDVQLRHGFLQAAGLLVGDAVGLQHIVDDVVRHPQLLRADEHEADVLAAGHGLDEGVDGAAELQVAAQADGQVIQPALAAADGHQVGQGLGGVLVAAVAGVDDRDAGVAGGAQRCALLGVAHGHDVGIAGDHADGVGHALALGWRWRRCSLGKPSTWPPRFSMAASKERRVRVEGS